MTNKGIEIQLPLLQTDNPSEYHIPEQSNEAKKSYI
jgi:hypothetical protein